MSISSAVALQNSILTDEDEFDDEVTPFSISELVEYFLTFESKNFSEFSTQSPYLADMVHKILYDLEDDKIGRIKDLFDDEIKQIANFVESNHETNAFAKFVLNETLTSS
tara:strand:+ start:558 stop:887 length:330 start_codon:yes stop_codon:yes gene_type:complete